MTASTLRERQPLTGKLSAVLILLGISVFINYVDRGNLSIAAPMLKDELGISASQLGMLLSAFFWTYACLQPFSGWLVDRLNVNWVIAGGFFLWSAATAATGIVHTFAVLFVLRLLLGIGESVAYPSYSKIIALNFPEEHRGLANSVISAGLVLGPGFGMLIGGMLMARFGWRPFFIVLGLPVCFGWFPGSSGCRRSAKQFTRTQTGAPGLPEFLRLAIGLGNLRRPVLRQLRELFPHHLAALLPGARAALLHGHHGQDRRHRLSAGRVFRHAVGLAFRPLDHVGSDSHARAQDIYGWRDGACRDFPGARRRQRARLLRCRAHSGCDFLRRAPLPMSGPLRRHLRDRKAAGRWTGFQNFVGNLAGVVAPALTGFVLQRTGHFYWAFAILTAVALTGTMSWVFLVGPVEQVSLAQASASQRTFCLTAIDP